MSKRSCILLLIFVMTAVLFCTAYSKEDSSEIGIEEGQRMPDFTVSLTDNTTVSLSELLKDKDLVVLNIFASWCKPCEAEFPEMEKVYQANSDRMVILSVSGDPKDTMEMIADYKESHGLSFLMGLAGDALSFFKVPAFPTTILIDGEGNVGLIKVGAFLGENEFAEKVDYFLSADYNGTPLSREIAHSYTSYILIAILVLILLCIISRWILFHKGGKPGWHSLIPVLSDCQEYALCWKGWIGLIPVICPVATIAINLAINNNVLPDSAICSIVKAILAITFIVVYLVESMKLAKAFGKKKGAGFLLWITGPIGRLVLGISKAKYQGLNAS